MIYFGFVQRLIALKRAYADIILNTAKEAAARVVASETKASRLGKELKDCKEQALQMLLRLKKMMDSKVKICSCPSVIYYIFVFGLVFCNV